MLQRERTIDAAHIADELGITAKRWALAGRVRGAYLPPTETRGPALLLGLTISPAEHEWLLFQAAAHVMLDHRTLTVYPYAVDCALYYAPRDERAASLLADELCGRVAPRNLR